MKRQNLSELLDCVIVIDSSDSMRYARKKISRKGIAIADKYLAKGKKVAVFNFGCRSIITDFSENKRKIHQAIRRYQGGGSTRRYRGRDSDFNTELLEHLIEDYEHSIHQIAPQVDIKIFSDMDIYELDIFDSYFTRYIKKLAEKHKVALFLRKTDLPYDALCMNEIKELQKDTPNLSYSEI